MIFYMAKEKETGKQLERARRKDSNLNSFQNVINNNAEKLFTNYGAGGGK